MGSPGTFFVHEGKRIKINDAALSTDGSLSMIKITPEGKGPQPFVAWLSNQA